MTFYIRIINISFFLLIKYGSPSFWVFFSPLPFWIWIPPNAQVGNQFKHFDLLFSLPMYHEYCFRRKWSDSWGLSKFYNQSMPNIFWCLKHITISHRMVHESIPIKKKKNLFLSIPYMNECFFFLLLLISRGWFRPLMILQSISNENCRLQKNQSLYSRWVSAASEWSTENNGNSSRGPVMSNPGLELQRPWLAWSSSRRPKTWVSEGSE